MLKELEQKITETFASLKYPGDENIVPSRPYLDLEREEIKEAFKGKEWREINFNYLQDSYDGDKSACLNLMTAEAFRYYLPAYMLICMHNYEESDMLYDSLFSNLTKEMDLEDPFLERIEPFSNNIKKVIAEFIWTMHEQHGQNSIYSLSPISQEQAAFMSYWNDYYKPDYSKLASKSK